MSVLLALVDHREEFFNHAGAEHCFLNHVETMLSASSIGSANVFGQTRAFDAAWRRRKPASARRPRSARRTSGR